MGKAVELLFISFCSSCLKGHGSHSHDSHVHSATAAADTAQSHLESGEAHSHVDLLKHQISQVEPDVFIGLSLCCGFVFMLLIDHISGGHSHAPSGSGNSLKSSHGSCTMYISVCCRLNLHISQPSRGPIFPIFPIYFIGSYKTPIIGQKLLLICPINTMYMYCLLLNT